MYPEIKAKIKELETTVYETGNRYEIELLDDVIAMLGDVYFDARAYKKMDRIANVLTTCTKIYEPKRKRDSKNINNIIEVVNTYSRLLYENITLKEEEEAKRVDEAQERRAAFKVV